MGACRSATVVLVTVVLLGLVTVSPSDAAFPGRDGVIVFAVNNSDRDGDGKLDTVSASGAHLRTIYSEGYGGSGQLDPSYSPNGRQIVFDTNGQGPLVPPAGYSYMEGMNSDGSGLFAISGGAGSGPVWGPNGESIAFTSSAGVSTLDLTTGTTNLIAGPGAAEPAWSSRDQIAYVQRRNLYIVSAAGGTARRLTSRGGRQPDFFPDGSRVAFVRTVGGRGQIFTIGATGRHLRQLTTMKRASTSPAVSPDGRYIAFIRDIGRSENTSFTDRLWTMRSNGTQANAIKHLPPSDYGLIQLAHPSWQPLTTRARPAPAA